MIDLIKNCPLFLELHDDEIESIVADCSVISHTEGDYIIREGEQGRDFYVLLSGNVLISKDIRGRETPITTLKKGDVFGETVLINEHTRSTHVIAKSRCDVLVIDNHAIFNMYNKSPKIFSILILNMARILTKRLRASNKVISSIHERLQKVS